MKRISILISLILFLLVGISVYSQESSTPVTQGQVQPRKLNSASSAKNNVESKCNNNICTDPISKINQSDNHIGNANSQSSYRPNNDCKFGTVENDPITRYNFLMMIFTGLLFFCNVFLLLSTRKAANAAKKSADAADRSATVLEGVEMPFLKLYHFDFGDMGVANAAAKFQYPKIEISVKNYGRTPAFEIEQAIEVAYGSLLNKQPYRTVTTMPLNTIIESKTIYDFILRPDILVSEENYKAAIQGKSYLWIYGYISYSDFLGNTHKFRFCRRYDIKTKSFIKVEDEDYENNY